MVVEEADRVRRRELERAPGRGRPERRRQRHEEVRAEPLRVAALVEVAAERVRARSRPRRASAARCAASGRSPRAGRGTAGSRRSARCANGRRPEYSRPQLVAADRERHLRLAASRTPSSVEEPVRAAGSSASLWTRKPVSSASPSCDDGVRVPAGAAVALEQLDLVRAREHVRGAEARRSRCRRSLSASTDIRSGCEYRFADGSKSARHGSAAMTRSTETAPGVGTVRAADEPHQPGRDAGRRPRPAARDRLGDGPALGRRLPPGRPRAPGRHVRRLRVRDHDRLPPLLHAPRLRDARAGQGDCSRSSAA